MKRKILEDESVNGVINGGEEMRKDKLLKVLAIALFISLLFPMFTIKSNHYCDYNEECLCIYYNGKVGDCVQTSIDGLYTGIMLIWYFAIIGGAVILNKQKNAISPFVIMGLLFGLAIWGTCIDPAKWKFVIALLPSLIIFVTAVAIDRKKN